MEMNRLTYQPLIPAVSHEVGPHHPWCSLVVAQSSILAPRCTCRMVNAEYRMPVITDMAWSKTWYGYWLDGTVACVARAVYWPHVVAPYVSHYKHGARRLGDVRM